MSMLPKVKQDKIVVRLWKKMAANLGHRWASQFGYALKQNNEGDFLDELTDTACEWRGNLQGFTAEQIGVGIERSKAMPGDWWPTFQGFRELCMPRPEDIGLPTVEQAYLQAVNKDWRHAIVWHAVQQIGPYEFHHQQEAKSRKLFSRVYGAMVARAISGERFVIPVVEAPQLAYEAPVVVEAHGDPKSHIAAMFSMLGKRGGTE